MKRKILPVLIALLLMAIIGGVAVGSVLYDKYSYSKERADWEEFYQVSGKESAIILQDERVEEKAIIQDGLVYFDLATVHAYFDETFYVDLNENLLLYSNPTDTFRVNLGSSTVTSDGTGAAQDMGYVIAYVENDTVYVAADYVKQYVNYSYDVYDMHIQVYTRWGERQLADIAKDTAVRTKGGVKSPILEDLVKGDTVEVLEEMENWSKVKTADSVIGYVENKRLTNSRTESETPVTDVAVPEFTSKTMENKISLGWHAIGAAAGNDTLYSMVQGTKGMNVIAPTWFSLNDNEGNFRDFSSSSYVTQAHNMGLQVWGVLDDFNYNNEKGGGIDVYSILSSTTKRQHLVDGITKAALACGMDGINLDFERVSTEAGVHYVQFLRELSIACRNNDLMFSIDNYVPFHFNDYYRLDIQGEVADYVIIMGYDEHWHGSGDPGSVASIDYVSNGLDKTLEEVPANKVVNALPLYTIVWKIDGSTVTDEYLTLNNMDAFLSRINAEKVWDEETCQNYLEWTSGSATYRVWLEDLESIRVKLNVMANKQIGGVAVWRLGYGTSNIWELLNAYSSS